MIASVSGDTCLSCWSTSMPVMPGMRMSRMAASKVLFSTAFSAARPSGQTVTSCPRRGSSERMNSCNDFSSSANRMRRVLCGKVAKRFLLDWLSRLERQAHGERAAPLRSRAVRLDLSSVLTDDTVADGQPQAGALAGAAARVERLENGFEHVRRHAAAGVVELQDRHPRPRRQRDGERPAFV